MSGARHSLRVVLVACTLLGLAAVPASGALLAAEDATELAQQLADATEEQGVCYGWNATIQDDQTGSSGSDVGSSFGPGVDLAEAPEATSCTASVQLRVDINYTSNSSEVEDSATITVVNLGDEISEADVESLGYDTGDLLGDDDDVALYNMVAGLPLLAADAGIADPVPFEPPTGTEMSQAAGEQPNDSPGSDWWRMYWWFPVLVVPIVLFGLLYMIGVVRRTLRPARERRRSRGNP